ncbi:MAG: hypothetical protein COW13_01820 [Candidatus Omnitrophica bacterium CG12_big_fil_rev_8_21_14_0_65_50_5]|nr:MAG: hypothetical protein COW13_01820 [Candidatus Omnitrophica bacterium CG12_big_fil_rev_8_21_14_0_65_50_5]
MVPSYLKFIVVEKIMETMPIEPVNEDLDRAKRELNILYEISNAMRTTLELESILYIILTGVTSHAGLAFNRAILFLVDPVHNRLEPQMAIGPESGEHAHKIWSYLTESKQNMVDLITEDRIETNTKDSSLFNSVKNFKISLDPDANQNLLAQAYHLGQAMHITPERIHEFNGDPLLQCFPTKELAIMPLKAKDKVNGIIIADNWYTQKPITEDDLRIFAMLANQAGLAIENSRLYEIVKHKSDTDALTDLWNHGFFQSQLNEEIENHRRNSRPLSLVMLDIDNFKKLNDVYGHQTGDMILKGIANVLKESSRQQDYICRYGGEEFSLILTDTNKEQGHAIAERVRKHIEGLAFPTPKSETPLKVTVSLGLAAFPDNASAKDDLIAKADKAMYIAKFSGKNQTCTA